MNIFNLPQDIFPGNCKPEGIIFHRYSAPVGSFKGKSILHMNAISLVISGEKSMFFSDKTVNIKNDEFHFLSSGNCIVSMDLSKKQPFQSILIFFDDKALTNFYLKYNYKIKSANKKATKHESYIAFRKDPFVVNYITSLELLFKSSMKISDEMKVLKFEELLLHLLEEDPGKFLAFQNEKTKKSTELKIRRALENNITNAISVEELAFLCDLSLSTFKRHFASIYRTSPTQWLLQKRIEIAKDLLLHHNQKPSEVYHQVGYENHSSFSQSFRQSVGVTPKEFQKQQLNVKR